MTGQGIRHLSDVLDGLGPLTVTGPGDVVLAGITADHRDVKPGFLFAGLKGSRVDGAHFAADAVKAGAVAVLIAEDTALPADLAATVVRAGDPRRVLALIAARFAGPQPERIVAVTGTAGKSSVADFTRQIFAATGRNAASVGTLGVITEKGADYGSLTTPDPVALHVRFAALAADGVTDIAMEASSHGIDQRRLDGVPLKAAAFTNLGRDHLDYHPDMEAYFHAKARLFDTLLPEGAPAVVVVDDEAGGRVRSLVRKQGRPLIDIAKRSAAQARLRVVEINTLGRRQQIVFSFDGHVRRAELPLAGYFQVTNALTAAALAMSAGVDEDTAFSAIDTLKGVPGRLEYVGERQWDGAGGAAVYVDYSHKPEALENALYALRPFTAGKLIVVIGCGGDRDPGKRPIMGEIAARRADLAIITDDNPRSEPPHAIRAAMRRGAPDAVEIGDRLAAIDYAINAARPGDTVLIAGKGHETGQIIGDQTLPFCDKSVARQVIDTLS